MTNVRAEPEDELEDAVEHIGAAPGSKTAKDRQYVTALARGLSVLRAFTAERRELGSSAIARLTKLPQPTVWRLCKTLQDEGYLMPAPGGDRFQLSPSVLNLGHSALASIPIAEIAKPTMQVLADRFVAGCSLGMRDGLHMILVQRCQGNATLVLNWQVGSRLPIAESAIGTAYIAALDEAERRTLLDELKASDQARWPAREKTIQAMLQEYRQYGYIANCGGFHSQINTVALGFRTGDRTQYALTCGAPADRLDLPAMRAEVAPALQQLTRALGADRDG